MTNEQLHTSNKGFLVTNSANVNAVYGPWESVNAAKSFLLERFSKMNDDFQIVSTIPVGTTVGVYDDASKQTVTEYWWSSNNLVLKTFGNIHYELQLYDNLDNLIKEINIRNGYVYYPEYVKPITIDNSTKQVVNIGYIRYSYDNSEFITYNSNIDRLGISTDKATHSLLVEWLDNDDLLITSLTLPVYGLSNITLIFYSYNNNETEAPSISIGSNYQNEDWTPNDYGSTIWSKTRFGITDLNHIEWAVSRERIDGKWGDLTDPIITGRWGIDAITSTVKQSLYYYTDTLVNNALDFFDKSLDYLNTVDDYELKDSYSIDGKIWYKDFTGVTPKQRYCYITQRDKNPDKHSLWYTPALFANFSVDGKDADDVEYIYCVSSTNTLNSSDIQQLRQIESVYSTTSFNPGKKLDFTTSGNWTDDPQGVTQETRYEFCAMRKNSKDELGIINYGTFEDPFIWAAFGEQGPDGPGLEYVYILTTGVTDVPTILYPDKDINGRTVNEDEYLPKSVTNSWSDNPLLVTHAYPVLWMSSRKGSEGKWGEFKTPVIWNQFSHSYEIRLSNDNCSIPASAEGIYTADVISKATATKVEVFLGNENVTDDSSIIISCPGYTQNKTTGLWYTNATNLTFDPIYLATFTATKNGKEIATKTQSLQLTKGKDGYRLVCIPNSRIWYGGSDYSSNTFLIKVYKDESSGVSKELTGSDLVGFKLKLQISNDSSTAEEINITSDLVINHISNATYNDIYVSLIKNSEMVDYDIIDAVDYSRIKGKDHEGVVLECEDNINIPNSKRNSIEYIRNATRSKLRLYRGVIDITKDAIFTAEGVNLENPLTETVTVKQDENDKTVFYLDLELTSDVQILYTATVNLEGLNVVYEATLRVNLSSELVTYEMRPNMTHLSSNEAEGLDVSTITFNVVSSDSNLPNYEIIGYIENTELSTSVSGTSSTCVFTIPSSFINYFKSSTSNQYLSFNLEVNGKIEDWETITVSPTPQLNGYNYTIDLSDPYLQIPIDLSDDVLQKFSLNTFTVYLGKTKIVGREDNSQGYPYYTVSKLLDKGVSCLLSNGDWTSYLTKDLEDVEKVQYKVTIYESENISYEFYKSQSVSFVNQVVYKLISNPTTVVTEAKQAGTFIYTPTVLKILNGELININNLDEEGLTCKCGEEEFKQATSLSYTENTSSLTVLLYKGNIFYDLDDIAIVRNGIHGADGLSSEYIYGRLSDISVGEINPQLLSNDPYNQITQYKNGNLDFSKGPIKIGEIDWTDKPQGVTDVYILEFVSVSKKENDTWGYFSEPKVFAHFGKHGDDGQEGKSASLRMCGEWLPNELYYAKQLLNNIYYTDVVIYTSDSSLKFYLAIKNSNGSTFNSSDWLEIPYSEIQLTLELYITDSTGNISGGFVDTNKGLTSKSGDILLWSGGTGTTIYGSANNATFSVTRGGVIRAKEGLFEGMYAPKLKVFSKPPLVSSLPFIPIIDDENRCDTIVDFSKLNETSFFNSKSNNQARFTLSYNDGSETCYGGEPVIYLPTGFLLPKLNQDNSTDGAKTLYAISLLQNSYIGEPLKTGANILYYNANDTYGYITENNLELNKHLVKWLLGKMNEKLSDYDVTSSNLIPTLLGNTNFVNLLYQYHRSLFIKALSYVGKTFTFINAPEIKGIRGYIHKGSNSNDDLIVPATLLELLYISNKYYSDGLNIVKEVDPTLFELGHYIINKDWVRYTDYDQDYTNTGMISVQSKLIPISDTVIPGNLKSAYIGWDVVSGPFGGTIKETNPSISFPSVNY